MKILNNQTLSYDHLLSYTCYVRKDEILKLVDFMCRNMAVLNNTVDGFPLIIYEIEDNEPSEILIPIMENQTEIQPEFEYKHNFEISNALKLRYTGSIEKIDNAKDYLMEYISRNSMNKEGYFIYSVINIDSEKNENNIIDVYFSCPQK
ncbi:MAG: hypothetical protein MJ095_01805 [Oscillospiraceae bacterium]|nr:hypothetical protein [Oscillospiraceae bacterium]